MPCSSASFSLINIENICFGKTINNIDTINPITAIIIIDLK